MYYNLTQPYNNDESQVIKVNIFKRIGSFLVIVLIIILLIPLALLYLLFVPFDIIRYYQMPYYKDLKIKYHFFITSKGIVKLYNRIKKNNINVSFYRNGEFEYFIKDDTVLLYDWSHANFEKENGDWYLVEEHTDSEYEGLLLKDILEEERKNLKFEHQKIPIKILVFYSDVTDADRWKELQSSFCFACYFNLDDFT